MVGWLMLGRAMDIECAGGWVWYGVRALFPFARQGVEASCFVSARVCSFLLVSVNIELRGNELAGSVKPSEAND
jgi:hypothetical protein